jgi:hypothetical protein
MKALFFLINILLFSNFAVSSEESTKPRLPYLDWGACPFECCTYREWVANSPINVYKSRNEKSDMVFKLKKNERVRALTGVVVTHKLGITEILKPVKIGYTSMGDVPQLSLKQGDIVYTLHYAGEGFEVFWFKGKTYSDELSITNSDSFKTINSSGYVWWAKVRNRSGKTGWTNQTNLFNNQDSCG